MQETIQVSLNKSYGEGVLTVANLFRRGSQNYSLKNSKDPARIVYLKAILEFQKDYNLTERQRPGTPSLFSLMGASSEGVEGIKSEGNRKGETLSINGLMTFALRDEQWTPIVIESQNKNFDQQPSSLIVSEIDSTDNRSGDENWGKQYTSDLREFIVALKSGKNQTPYTLMKQDLDLALLKAKLRKAHSEGQSTIVTATPLGEYYRVGKTLAGLSWPNKLGKLQSYGTNGTNVNIQLVEPDLAGFAITQSDLAVHSYRGSGTFEGKTKTSLRAVMALYQETIHLIVQTDSGIQDIDDLVGKRVNMGVFGSGTFNNAKELLQNVDVNISGFSHWDLSRVGKSFARGELDAFFLTTAVPSQFILSLEAEYRLIPLVGDALVNNASKDLYTQTEIPAETYQGQTSPIDSLGVTALIVTHESTSSKKVNAFLTGVQNNSKELLKHKVRVNSLSRAELPTIGIPLHPAAQAFYSDAAQQ
ncbi:MAG: TRAP transporter TAXI family solute receptor [Pseudohongiellaceae bacterium]|jgi:TRAP transporter TAXI family solute receptor